MPFDITNASTLIVTNDLEALTPSGSGHHSPSWDRRGTRKTRSTAESIRLNLLVDPVVAIFCSSRRRPGAVARRRKRCQRLRRDRPWNL